MNGHEYYFKKTSFLFVLKQSQVFDLQGSLTNCCVSRTEISGEPATVILYLYQYESLSLGKLSLESPLYRVMVPRQISRFELVSEPRASCRN